LPFPRKKPFRKGKILEKSGPKLALLCVGIPILQRTAATDQVSMANTRAVQDKSIKHVYHHIGAYEIDG
jgi:hypothetical protein